MARWGRLPNGNARRRSNMPDTEPKLKLAPRRRRKSIKSKIRQRANEQVKQAAVEARKTAVLEYVGEQIEDLLALLRAEGFHASRPREAIPHEVDVYTRASAEMLAAKLVVKNPCAYCGAPGTHLNEMGTGHLCDTHWAYEQGGREEKIGQNLAQQMLAPKAINPKVAAPKPSGPKIVIHPNTAEMNGQIDPLKGVQNGTVGELGGDSEEAGDSE